MKKFITIKNNTEYTFIEKKSTFITHIIRINSEQEARNFIQQMKKQHYNSNHVCSAYVFGDNNEIMRSNDDGEPSGTAGAPILDVLFKNNIHNVCAVVIRYFGGIKLGTGGLVRAYSYGVKEAIKKSILVEKKNAFEINLEIEYNLNGKIDYEINKTNFIVNNIEYSDKIIYTIFVIEKNYNIFIEWITNLTNNNFKIMSINEKQLEFNIQDN